VIDGGAAVNVSCGTTGGGGGVSLQIRGTFIVMPATCIVLSHSCTIFTGLIVGACTGKPGSESAEALCVDKKSAIKALTKNKIRVF
jgi:hypothetical protein